MAKNRKGGGGHKQHGSSSSNNNNHGTTASIPAPTFTGQTPPVQPSTGLFESTSSIGGGTGTTMLSSSGIMSGNNHNHMDPLSHTTALRNGNLPPIQQQQQQQHSTTHVSLFDWLFEYGGIYYLFFFMIFGFSFGFMFGNIQFISLPIQKTYLSIIRFRPLTHVDQMGKFMNHPLRSLSDMVILSSSTNTKSTTAGYLNNEIYFNDPSNTRIFSILREAIVREPGGYVHRDLGLMIPAPSGSVRGLGMVRNNYYTCQRNCFSNNPDEQQQQQQHQNNTTVSSTDDDDDQNGTTTTTDNTKTYRQDEILIRVPLSYQMTRTIAMQTLGTIIPQEVQVRTNMQAYDDSMYLTLLLAHERGVGEYSKWLPYIASLPREPTCGYSQKLRPYMLNAIEAYRVEWDVDTNGWGEEVYKALIYAERIIDNMNTHFGSYLETPPGISTIDNLRWALCQVVSRGIAGSMEYGMLRLVPIIDLINHDGDAAAIVELAGNERKEDGYFMDSISEYGNGTFVVRSMRHGRLRPLRRGQELMMNYNVPYYTPLDWFVYSGFVPPERSGPWIKLDAVLPPVRHDGPFAFEYGDAEEHWKRKEEQLMQRVKEAEALYLNPQS